MSTAESNRQISHATTLMVRDTCLCLHLQRAARAVAREFDEALRPVGLTSGQFSLLMSLNRPEPPTIGNVAALLAMDRTTLTANLKPLGRRGLIELRVGSSDRRSRRLILTGAGRDLLTEALPLWAIRHREIESLLAGSDADALRTELLALSRGQRVAPGATPKAMRSRAGALARRGL
ncbi:MAG: MarR family winged helix-turn-helix transcriptional regulator [Alphaproteobacteria bacterium]